VVRLVLLLLLQAGALLADVPGQRSLLDQASKAQQLLAQVRLTAAVTVPAHLSTHCCA
jgi:hypothetical protein